MGSDDPGGADALRGLSGGKENRIPYAVQMEQVHAGKMLVQPTPGPTCSKSFVGRTRWEQVQFLRPRLRCSCQHGLNSGSSILGCVPKYFGLVPSITLSRSESCHHDGWAALGGIKG